MAAEDKRQNYSRPLSAEEIKAVFKTGLVLSVAALVFMIGFGLFVYHDVIQIHPKSMHSEMLRGFAPRVEYAFRYQTLLVFWLVFNIMATIYGRVSTGALNPLEAGTEKNVQLFKSILTNSFESIVVSVFSQLIFVSFAEANVILKAIPYVNIVQLIGRIAFFAGYPLKRAFGYQCTIFPNLILASYNMYKLGSFVGLY